MQKKIGRPRKDPAESISRVISFGVKPDTFLAIESSTAGERSEFWRAVAEKIAAAIEAGDSVVSIPLAHMDNYQAITTGAQNDAKP